MDDGLKMFFEFEETKINLIWEKNIWRRREVSEQSKPHLSLAFKRNKINDMIPL
jgi:hypothetical protein